MHIEQKPLFFMGVLRSPMWKISKGFFEVPQGYANYSPWAAPLGNNSRITSLLQNNPYLFVSPRHKRCTKVLLLMHAFGHVRHHRHCRYSFHASIHLTAWKCRLVLQVLSLVNMKKRVCVVYPQEAKEF